MKKIIKLSSFAFFLLLLISCSGDGDDDIGPIDGSDNGDVTYTGTVKAIIDGKCLACHSNPTQNDAPMPLTTYEEVKSAVQTRGLISQVQSGNMPKEGTPLTSTQVQAIMDWQSGGFLQ